MKIQGDEIIKQSATFRGLKQFDKAIKLIEDNIDSINKDIRVNAWLEAFYAAKEKDDKELIKKYARLVSNEDPEVPSIQDYL